LFTIHVNPAVRDDVLTRLQSQGIGIAVNYRAVHLRRYYRDRYGYGEGRFPVAEHIGNSTISLPLYPDLNDAEVQYIIDKTIEACKSKLSR
jgi:UDP-4-amino-4-deoxy-L-arabinose-oxoglutarate aminotransferase